MLINNGPFSKHSELAHIAAVLNWLGLKSYQVFNNLNFDAESKDKSKIDDVLFMLEKHFKPTHLYSNHGTNLVLYIQANVKMKLNLCLNSVMLQMTVALLIRIK